MDARPTYLIFMDTPIFVIKENCKIMIAFGRENAEKALEILNKDSIAGVIAIVDSDFRHLENIAPHHQNLFFTDTHDLETMILKSSSFEKVIGEFVSEDKVSGYGEDRAGRIREILLESALPLGYLLWISLKEEYNLKFEDIVFSKFIGKDNLENDLTEMIKEVKNKSQRHDINHNEILNKIENHLGQKHNPWMVCCGHHLVCILSIGFQKLWASRNSREVTSEILERELRLAYEYSQFRETVLFSSIRQWESINPSWRILKQ